MSLSYRYWVLGTKESPVVDREKLKKMHCDDKSLQKFWEKDDGNRIVELAHGSIMGGHMGIKKTVDKIQSGFYRPDIQGDVTHYCKSCDVCQKTVNKGSVQKVPL